MRLDDCLFARLQRPIEVGGDDNVVRNKSDAAEGAFQFRAKLDQDNSRAGFGGCLLDLRKALRCRRIDAGDALKVEDQETTFSLLRKQRLDVLVKPVGRTEEQIALQRDTLNLSAVI